MKKNKKNIFLNYFFIIFCAVLTASLIRFFFIESYRIPTNLMTPNLLPGDLIFVDKSAYDIRLPFIKKNTTLPNYGDVIIYHSLSEPNLLFIKRVIGLPHDVVSFSRGRLSLNNKTLDFIESEKKTCGFENHPHGKYKICLEPPLIELNEGVRVKDGEIFVITDLRTLNPDRPIWDVIYPSQILGKARLVWLSIDSSAPSSGFFPHIRFERSLLKAQ